MDTLRGFTTTARNVISAAVGRGWEVSVSNNGHAIMRWPHGGTVAVSRNLDGSRRLKNTVADISRVEREHPAPEPVWSIFTRASGEPNPAVETTGDRFRCSTCKKEFQTGRGASKHSTQSHGKGAITPDPGPEIAQPEVKQRDDTEPEVQPIRLLELVKSDLVRDLVLERERSAKILDNLAAVRDLINELLAEFS